MEFPFARYEVDTAKGQLEPRKTRGAWRGPVWDTDSKEYLELVVEPNCDCTKAARASCACLRYLWVNLRAGHLPAKAGSRRMMLARVLLFARDGLPKKKKKRVPPAEFGGWLAHHKNKVRRKVAGRQVWVADDDGLIEWELRGPHTAEHNRGRRTKVAKKNIQKK